MYNWKDKSVLIIGASSGIGEVAARHLDSLGAKTFLVARDSNKLKEICGELSEESDYMPFDLHNIESIKEIFEKAFENNHKFSGCFFSAGIDEGVPIRVNSINKEEEMMRVNTFSFLEVVKNITQKRYSTEDLSIVGMSSIVTKILNAGSVNYAMSKGALQIASKVAAREYSRRGIRVNTISPALTDTRLIMSRKEAGGLYADNGIHLQKYGYINPVQIAYLVEFLLSEKAKYITGADIEVSAGWGY